MSLPLLVTLIASAAASPEWVKKERDVPVYAAETSSWAHRGKASHDSSVKLTVALRVEEGRRAELERLFWEVSNPQNENYGKHRSMDEITEILAVPKEHILKVQQYFLNAGAESADVSPNGDMITVTTSVRAAETALNTELHYFTHMEHESVQIIRAMAHYSLPRTFQSM